MKPGVRVLPEKPVGRGVMRSGQAPAGREASSQAGTRGPGLHRGVKFGTIPGSKPRNPRLNQARQKGTTMAIRIKARNGESAEQMLRRFKKLCEKEGLTKEIKKRAYYEKPSERKQRALRKMVKRTDGPAPRGRRK